jgi:hypothetical protein
MRVCLAAIVACAWIAPAQAEVTLFAQYDWQNGATDVSGSPIRHDGVLEPGTSIVDGKLVVAGWDGVTLGQIPELDGATEALFRFEDVTFSSEPDQFTGWGILCGSGDDWWVAVHSHDGGTLLEFNLGGYGDHDALEVIVANEAVYHFDSIEYRLDGTAPLDERFAIRFDDGPWTVGGHGQDLFQSIPAADRVRINNGVPADWDPMWATLGTMSFYSNQIPEPSTLVLAMVGLLCGVLAVWKRRR